MFSNNNRISTRQVFRLFVFDFVGESTLILPSQLAAFAGNDGLASIVLGGIMGSLYLWYLAYVLKKDGNGSGHLYGTDSAGMDEKKFFWCYCWSILPVWQDTGHISFRT